MFCSNCGKKLPDGARFCSSCGKEVMMAGAVTPPPRINPQPLNAQPPNTQTASPQPANIQPVSPQPTFTQPVSPQPMNAAPVMMAGVPYGDVPLNPDVINYRVKCPACGKTQTARFHYTCKECGASAQVDPVNNGFLQLYRMGHFQGSMVREAIYLNGEKAGSVENTGSILFELPPGLYNLHAAITGLRNCEDIQIQILPGKTLYAKSQLKVGAIKNKILLHICDASEMPPLA